MRGCCGYFGKIKRLYPAVMVQAVAEPRMLSDPMLLALLPFPSFHVFSVWTFQITKIKVKVKISRRVIKYVIN
jgi:hypothetical protein